jgi:PmbA protein
MEDHKDLAERLVKRCLSKGAHAAEVYLEWGRNLSIEVRNGEVETVEEAASHGAGFRVFVKGSMAFAHCNDLSDSSLDDAIQRAVQFAAHTTADENNVLPDDPGITEVGELFDPDLSRVSMDEKIALAKKAEELAMKDRRITKSAGAGFSEGEGEVFLANSNGLSKSYRETGCSFGVSVVAEKGDQKSSGSEYCSRRFYADLKPVEEVAAKAAEDAYSMLDPRMVKTQQTAVIFDPDAARAVLGGILAAVNGERVLQGASFLRVPSTGRECPHRSGPSWTGGCSRASCTTPSWPSGRESRALATPAAGAFAACPGSAPTASTWLPETRIRRRS